MKYIFFGTPEFAAIILKKLIAAGMKPELVVCNPDKPVGRKKILTPPPVKQVAEKNDIKIWQPEKLVIAPTLPVGVSTTKDVGKNWKAEIKDSDLAVVAAYGKIIPRPILQSLPKGFVGVHPSLLPRYRGPSPIQTAILNGDETAGTSLFLIDEQVDHGPTLAKRTLEFPISNFQFLKLQEKLAELSADLLIETLPKYISGEIKPKEQNHAAATYCKKFTTDEGQIEFEGLKTAVKLGGKLALHIDRKIRALEAEPGVWTVLPNGKRMKLLVTKVTQDKKLVLKTIQVEGKTPTNTLPDELTK